MAQDRVPESGGYNQEDLVRLLLDYEQKHGEKGGWLLIALCLVYLGQMVRLIEKRAGVLPSATGGKDLSARGGGALTDLLSTLGPLMNAFNPPPPPVPEPPLPEEAPPARNEVIKWDPRLVGGTRK